MRKREWVKCNDPVPMLRVVWTPPGPDPFRDRRLRIFALTAGQPALARVDHPLCDWAAGLGWRKAEGISTPGEVASCVEALQPIMEDAVATESLELARLVDCLTLLIADFPIGAANGLLAPLDVARPGQSGALLTPAEAAASCHSLRDIFGDRGRVIVAHQDWLTSTVVALARGVYDEQAFDRLPILADALEEAGCADSDVLTHCRGPGPHVRGCWVVDALLGKGTA